MFPALTRDRDELAPILAIKIAHVLANHHMEAESWKHVTRRSRKFSEYLEERNQQELDYITLMLMAEAGFNLSATVSLCAKVREIEKMVQNVIPNANPMMPRRIAVSCSHA